MTQPFKCPCCDGWGYRPDPATRAGEEPQQVECEACGTSGVVWGPPSEEERVWVVPSVFSAEPLPAVSTYIVSYPGPANPDEEKPS